jgi:Cys-rich protein (TIGR01571 family)
MSSRPPATWSTTLFGCFTGKDAGLNCCIQQCCCGPCVWSDALTHAGVPNAALYGFAVCLGGDTVFDELASFAARKALLRKYGISEPETTTCAYVLCCGPCARCQEVATVAERERLHYGCASLVPDAPAPARMTRTAPRRT